VNITGQTLRDLELAGKRLELLKEAAPHITHMAVLTTNSPSYRHVPSAFEAEARALRVRLQRVDVDNPRAFDQAFATMATSGADALMIMDSSVFSQHRQQLLDLARTHRLPTVWGVHDHGRSRLGAGLRANLPRWPLSGNTCQGLRAW
jgi:ABC-type uncharacterized transport system substrate-binding protein